MNSKLFLFALFGLISVSLCSQTSFAFAQEDFQLKYDAFLQSTSILAGDKLIFSTVAKDSPPSISVQDTKTGSLLYKLYTPHKSLDDGWFGDHMTTVGNNIAASSILYDPQTKESTTFVYVFNGDTGNLLYTIENPHSDSMFFGYTLKSIGDKLAVYASDADPNDDIHDNVVHVFDGKNGSLLYTVENPSDKGDFGKSISTINNSFLVHTRQNTGSNLSGIIHAFDADTGNLQYAIENPEKDAQNIDPYFGGQSIISGEHVVVRSDDVMFVYDGNTGDLLHTEDGFVTTNSELQTVLDSLDDKANYHSIIILVAGVAAAVTAVGVILLKRKQK